MEGNKIFKNATWIIVCRIIQAVLSVLVTMFSARYLGPSGYGLINYAASIVAFVAPIMHLGLSSTLVQEVVNAPEKEGETMGTALTMSFTSSFFCILGVVAFTLVANPGEKDTLIVCALYSVLLIFQSIDLLQYWFQAKLKSKYTSIIMLVAYAVTSIYKIVLLITGKSIYWFALAQAIDYLVIAVGLMISYYKVGEEKLSFSWAAVKRLFDKSKFYILSNLMITIFAQTDRIMLKIMCGDEATGFYSAAVTCATMASFVFAAIIDSFRPSIFEKKRDATKEEYEKSVAGLYSIIIYLSLIQCVAITLFAPWIIQILYGAEYAPTVSALQLTVWYTTFSYVGSARNVWILAEGQQKHLWILNLAGAVMNVVLNFIFIPLWGILGAAFASLVTQIFTNVFMNMMIPSIRRTNLLMLKGLNPALLFEMLKKLRKDKPQTVEEIENVENTESVEAVEKEQDIE